MLQYTTMNPNKNEDDVFRLVWQDKPTGKIYAVEFPGKSEAIYWGLLWARTCDRNGFVLPPFTASTIEAFIFRGRAGNRSTKALTLKDFEEISTNELAF